MTEHLVDASLTEWEDGIDLVLDTQVALPPTAVWPYLTRSELVKDWFVGFTTGEGAEEIFLELDDQPVPAHVLSVSAPQTDSDDSHVLLDIEGIGRLGLSLTPLVNGDNVGSAGVADSADLSGTANAADNANSADNAEPVVTGTRLTLSHTIADKGIDHAILAQVITQVGPVWETHLRLLAGTLTASPGAYDVPESQMTIRYERLAQEIE